ncbi:MAG TPA: thioredoxin family protein [Flavobacteriaceae bacterium]|nr:thioredoxin family protein [Flavobacteriaceae bacterium]
MSKIIKILGTGCPKCQTMTGVVKDVVSKNNIDATIEKVEDIMEIMKFNVMTTPALVIDDVVTIKGRIPSQAEVLELLN